MPIPVRKPPPKKKYLGAASKVAGPQLTPKVFPGGGGYGGGGGGGYGEPAGGDMGGYAGTGLVLGDYSGFFPQPNPDTDPAFQAFQRALEFEKEAKTGDAVRRILNSEAERDRQLAEIPITFGRQREEITGRFDSRGLVRSGAHERALTRSREDEGRRTANLRDAVARQVADYQAGLATALADIERRRAEARLSYGTKLY